MPDEVFIQSLFRKYSVNNEISVDTLEKVCNDNGIPLDWNEVTFLYYSLFILLSYNVYYP